MKFYLPPTVCNVSHEVAKLSPNFEDIASFSVIYDVFRLNDLATTYQEDYSVRLRISVKNEYTPKFPANSL